MAAILNQPWEDVADDVVGAIEKAVQPLLKTAVDDIYGGLLDATQDYLKDNLAFNIASRIDCAEREAARYRAENAELLEALESIAEYWNRDQNETAMANACWHAIETAEAAIAKARGQ